MPRPFRVGLTRDFLKADNTLAFGDIGLELLDETPGLEWDFLAENTPELSAAQIRDHDALLVLTSRLSAATLEGADRLAIVARFGVGYDSVDVQACTRKGVLLTITPDGVRLPMAHVALCFILALSHKLPLKDRLVREGRWAEKTEHMGTGLSGRTLGLVGLGNIGRTIAGLGRAFGLHCLAFDPHISAEQARASGAEQVDLNTLLQRSDFVCICCALTKETHHLIGKEQLALMRPTAYLVNVARGPIVDQQALTRALREKSIAGAGLDVFEKEPIDADDPLLALDNTILAPHALGWTDECFSGIGRSACRSILAVARGEIPEHVVNRPVLESPLLREKLRRFAGG